MKNRLLFLISVCLTALLFQPCSTASWKIRHWKGLLLLSKDKCANRCKFKHGYFMDAAGETQLAAKAKRGIIPGKCQCMVSPELRKYITQKLSLKVAKRYGLLNFFGRTKKGRDELQNLGMVFITYEQLNEIVKKKAAEERLQAAQKAADQKKLLAAKKAALTKTGSGASGTPSQKDSASGFGDVLNNLQYAEGVVFKSQDEIARELQEQIRKFKESEEAKKRQL